MPPSPALRPAALLILAALAGGGPAPAEAAAPVHGSGRMTVPIEVAAPIENGDVDRASRAARSEALRQAVERAVESRIDRSMATPARERVIRGVLDDPQSYATFETAEEEIVGGNLELKGRVVVDLSRIAAVLREAGLARSWRVVVVIPEWHIERPVPDPAAETEFIRQMVQAGFKVIDQARYAELRYQAAERLGEAAAAAEFARSVGADVIITGEAFSQRGRDVMGLTSCQARVEARAIMADTGEIISADAAEGSAAGTAEAVAAKKALQSTAAKLVPLFVEDLRLLPGSSGRTLQLEVGGFTALRDAASFERALAALPGIGQVTRESYLEGTIILEVVTEPGAAESLAEELESHSTLKPYRVTVQESTRSRIRAKVSPRSG